MSINPLYHHTEEKLQKELQLVKAAQRDPKRFAPLYDKYHEQIFRYIYQRMDDKELAFDVCSQVFLKALNNIERYEYRGVPFSSWLYRIAKSEVYQSFREKKAHRTVNVESVHLESFIEEWEDDTSEENRAILLNVIGQLKEAEVQLIEMRYFEKRSYREIGEILELTENNAKVKTHRVLNKMKKTYKKAYGQL
ncbi:MAG: sigma-70 family RNA polymerase sigma factor [Putridiphycobacter sp.]|jgi:RNA polymerase sigma-70 factor (ECF subfamily)|nr:sigma-70 family RNA polymerase sigma factor [Putridiphycobacter sp.]